MNRNTRTLLVLAVAVVMAGLAAYGVFLAVRSMPVREVEVARTQAVVATHAMGVGTLVTKDDVKLVPWPAASPVPGMFQQVEQAVNRGVIIAVSENEPLTESKLAPIGSGAGLPPTIPEGMRAISVRVNEIVGVAGFVIPGTHVDVVVTVQRPDKADQSRIVLSDVTVLTAGTRYDQERATKEGKPIPTSVVTMLLTPKDAETMTLAMEKGKIMLVLRNPLDSAPVETQGARLNALLGEPPPPPKKEYVQGRTIVKTVAPPAPPPAPKVYTVEAIRGAKRSEEEVR